MEVDYIGNRKRQNIVKFRLNDKELKILNNDVKKRGLVREAYLRSLINGDIPIGKGPDGYIDMIQSLRRIENNINQIARIANTTGIVDSERYKQNYEELSKIIHKIKLREPSRQHLVEKEPDENEKTN